MSLPLDGRISACLKGHSQLNESDVGLVPHGDVGAAVCNSDLLRECILLVTQVNSNTRGGWKVLNKEVVDGTAGLRRVLRCTFSSPGHRGRH